MEHNENKRLSREDWVQGALAIVLERGVDGVKIVNIAERMNVTSGSFYWHFKNLRELLDCLLEHWEVSLTDTIIVDARKFSGDPKERIVNLMLAVIENDASFYDHAILIWARNDQVAGDVFKRTMKKRFDFARWMFEQSGFSKRQATIRGRMMVAYLMGESSTSLKSNAKWKSVIREQFQLLITPAE